MTAVYKPAVVIEELGELGRLPDGGIVNIGGVQGPNFTVGDKGVILDDGSSSSDGSQIIQIGISAVGYEFTQLVASNTWTIAHAKNTKRITISIWDNDDELVLPDSIKMVDADTVLVNFNTPITGKAILILF